MLELVPCRLGCPVCATQFVADEVHGAVPIRRETDFRPVYDGPNPLLSNMHSCPGCAFSAYREGFETTPDEEDAEHAPDEPMSFPRGLVMLPDDDDLTELRRYVRSGQLTKDLVAQSEDAFGGRRYFLAARIREFLYEEDPLIAAHYYLRGAWTARAQHDLTFEQRGVREVVRRIRPVLDAAQPDGQGRLRLCYLVAELSRRSGDFAAAVDLFGVVQRDAETDDVEERFLASLAARQMTLAFMKSSVNATIPAELPGLPQRSPGDDAGGDGEGGNSLN